MAVVDDVVYGPPTLLEAERMAWRERQGRVQDRRRAQRMARELRLGEGEGPAWIRGRLKKAVDPRRVIDFLRSELAPRPETTTREQRVREHDMAKSKRIYEWCVARVNAETKPTASWALQLFNEAVAEGVTSGGLHGFFYQGLRPALQEQLGSPIGLTLGDIERKQKKSKGIDTRPPSARNSDPRKITADPDDDPTSPVNPGDSGEELDDQEGGVESDQDSATPPDLAGHVHDDRYADPRIVRRAKMAARGPERRIEGESVDPRGEEAPDRRETMRRAGWVGIGRSEVTEELTEAELTGPPGPFKDRRRRYGDRRVKMDRSPDGLHGPRELAGVSDRRLGYQRDSDEPRDLEMELAIREIESCRVCGCTDDDCSQCIEAQGFPCSWVPELATPDHRPICSRCVAEAVERVHPQAVNTAGPAAKPFALRLSGEWGYFEVASRFGVGNPSVSGSLPGDVADRLVGELMREYYPLGQ